GFDTGLADLTVNGSVNVQSGRLASSGGIVDFSGSVQFDPSLSALELANTTLTLSNSFQLSSVLRFGGTSSLPANDLLDLSEASIELAGDLNLTGVKTDNTTFIELTDNSSIRSDGQIVLGRMMPHGHSLELGSTDTELNLLGIGEPSELPESDGNPTLNMSPVIESLNAERLQNGGLKWSAVISDDSAFSSLTTHWEYLFGASRNFSTPVYRSGYSSQSGTVEVVMTDYDDSDSGMLLITVCEQASNHQGNCDSQQDGATSLSFELIPFAYQLPLICEDDDCIQPTDPLPEIPSSVPEANSIASSEANESSVEEGGNIFINGGVLKIQEQLLLNGNQIETGGGRLVLENGASLHQGASLKLDNGTLELGDSLKLDNSTLFSDSAVLKLLDNLSLIIPADISFREILLLQKTLTLDSSVSSLTLEEQLILDHAEARIIRNQAQMIMNAGVSIEQDGELNLDDPSKFNIGNISLNGGILFVNGDSDQEFKQNTVLSTISESKIVLSNDVHFEVDQLKLEADLEVEFGSENTFFKASEIVVNAEAKLSGNNVSKLLMNVISMIENSTEKLFLENIILQSDQCLDTVVQERIKTSENGFLNIGDEGDYELSGVQDLSDDVQCPIQLNDAQVCINEDIVITGSMSLLGNAEIYIAPNKTLTYQGVLPITIQNKQLSILGGGHFLSIDNHSNGIHLADDANLKIGGQNTTISHVSVNQSSENSVLEVLETWTEFCGQNSSTGSGNGIIKHLNSQGNFSIKLGNQTNLNLENSFAIEENKSLEIEGNGEAILSFGDNLTIGGTLSLKNETRLSGGLLNFDGGLLEVEEDSSIDSEINFFQSSIKVLENTELKLDNTTFSLNQSSFEIESGASIKFDNSTLKWQGQLSKIGEGNLILDKVLISGNASYSGSSEATIKNLQLDNNPFQLESPTSSFRLSEKLFVAGTQSELNTNDANLYLEKGLELSSGKLSSTGGRVDVQDNFTLIGGSLDFENTTLALDGTSSLSSGSLTVSSGTLALGGGFEKNGGTLSFSNTSFSLLDNLTWTSDSLLEVKTLELDNFSLTLGSASSDLKIIDPLILDHSNEKLISGEADLKFSGLLNISLGELSSSNGIIQLEQGVVLSGGKLTVPNSTLVIGNQFNKSGGSANLAGASLQLYSDLSLTSDTLLSVQSLDLNQQKLTLSDGGSDLEIQNLLEIDHANEGLITGDADLKLKQGISISAGEVISTAGTVAIKGASSLSSGTLSVSSGTLALGGSFEKNGGTLSFSDSSFSLLDNLSWTSDSLLEIKTLELDNFSLTLGSASSDLKIINPLILDHEEEKLISGEADLKFSGLLNISLGELSSSNGKIQLEQGVVLSGGKLTVPNSTLVIGNQFNKSGGSVNLAGTNLQLYSDLSLTSDTLLSFQSLELNQKKLTLSNGESDLEVHSLLEIDDVNEGLIIGNADLQLNQGISISAGEVTSTAGTVAINGTSNLSSGTLSVSSGTLALGGSFEKNGGTLSLSDSSFNLLDNLTWTSDSLLEIKTLELDNFSLTLGSASSDLKIIEPLILDHSDEKLISGEADLEFSGLLNISQGELSSSNGKIQLEQGVVLSGGELTVPNSTLVIGNQFSKSGGSVNLAGTNLQLFSDLSLTSNTLLSFQSLELNQKKLTLSNGESDLEVHSLLEIDDVNEGLITGDADLKLNQGISIIAGEVTSSAGTVAINGASSLNSGTLSVSSGTMALGGSFENNGGTLSFTNSS
ncbi:MAG: hypothetical protein VX208_07915, partial [SAR324 cluster bacterium]|nr:hypothetical protein [SAR324 cluster bacterium]